MQTPIVVRFEGAAPSPMLEATAREHLEHIERFHSQVDGCIVTVRTRAISRAASIHVELMVKGVAICNVSGTREGEWARDPLLALRDAFDAAMRKLREFELGRLACAGLRPSSGAVGEGSHEL